jgi:hypothetical protein
MINRSDMRDDVAPSGGRHQRFVAIILAAVAPVDK